MNCLRLLPGSRLILLILLVLVALSLPGCGFHLRGSVDMPSQMEITFIQGGNPYSVFIIELRQALESRNIELVTTSEDATAVLHVISQRSDRRTLSVDLTGKSLEFLIQYEVEFELRGEGDEVILPVQKVTSERAFVFVKTDVLGAEREANYIRDELERELVTLVMMRLSAIAS